ncbi:hypothetical protein [uncultured Nocardioides sp.]|uniref:hypothetical protein n=1 Tax=uncultured Nocardioides sp. TaxID=198441 RepID=UPI00262B92CA|nr:hypothetical protein [uncultured Nocardioides sp.]
MRTYRIVWTGAAGVAVGSACVLDIAAGGLVRMTLLGVGMGLFGAALAFALVEEREDRWPWVRRGLLWGAVGAVATDALAVAWGNTGVALGLGLLALSPPAVMLARTGFVGWSSRRAIGPPEALSLRDLHRRWEWTTAEVLRPTTSVPRRLVLVEERRRLLDELQLRDPVRFDAWLLTAVPERRRARSWPPGR